MAPCKSHHAQRFRFALNVAAIKLSKALNTLTGTVRREKTIVKKMKAPVNYDGAFSRSTPAIDVSEMPGLSILLRTHCLLGFIPSQAAQCTFDTYVAHEIFN